MPKFKYFGMTVINYNCIHTEIKRRLNVGNPCYNSVENLFKIYKTTILPVVLYGSETWSLDL
jgi:hypothetical protein